MDHLITITAQEAKYLRKNYPELPIAMACGKKKSRRKTYYAEETNQVINILNNFEKELTSK